MAKLGWFVLCLFVYSECTVKKENAPVAAPQAIAVYHPVATEKPGSCSLLEITPLMDDESRKKACLKKAKEMREELIAKLEKATPEEANRIYASCKYRFDHTPEFSELERIVQPVLDRWMTNVLVEREEPEGEDKTVIDLLKKEGLEPRYAGEGFMDLGTNAYYYYSIFEPYVTADTREFMQILAEQDDPLSANVGLVVSYEDMLSRCARWEDFMNKYPDSPYRKEAIDQYDECVWLMENNPNVYADERLPARPQTLCPPL
jgi:hypothetical protein